MSRPQRQEQIASRADFARIVGVHRSRVTRWISEGKISAAALIGEGAGARIRVRLAKADLRRTLDVGQRFGNGIDTRLDDDFGQEFDHAKKGSAIQPKDTLEEQIKRERLETLQRQNRKLAEDEAARAGRFCLADDAAREMGRIAGRMMADFESAISDMAFQVASKTGTPSRDVLHAMKLAFHSWRERSTRALNKEAERLPEFVEQEIDEARAERSVEAAANEDESADEPNEVADDDAD